MNEFALALALLSELNQVRPHPPVQAFKNPPVAVQGKISKADKKLLRDYVARVERCGTGQLAKDSSGFYLPVLLENCK